MKLCKKIMAIMLVLLLLAAAPAAYATEQEGPDTERLQELLQMADDMQQYDYTAESWSALSKAVAVANAAISSGQQVAIDSATGNLGSALSKMEKMDYSQMDAALSEAEQFLKEYGPQWQKLQEALSEVHVAYQTGDQTAVDRAAAGLADSLRACREAEAGKKGSGSVIWIILLIISLLGNGALVTLLVWKKKGNQRKQIDDVPLVDYDIDDDVI